VFRYVLNPDHTVPPGRVSRYVATASGLSHHVISWLKHSKFPNSSATKWREDLAQGFNQVSTLGRGPPLDPSCRVRHRPCDGGKGRQGCESPASGRFCKLSEQSSGQKRSLCPVTRHYSPFRAIIITSYNPGLKPWAEIGVGTTCLRWPLPPNRAGEFLVHGSPVGG
jgi:hypothetical protein